MKESYSGLFRRDPSVPHSGMSRVPSGGHKEFGKYTPSVAAKEKPKSPTHSSSVGGKEELHPDAQSAINRVKGKGGYVTRLRDQGIEYKENKENIAKAVAKELGESWWCGTPEVMERERKLKADNNMAKSNFPTFSLKVPDKAGNWSTDAMDKPMTEAEKAKAKSAPQAAKPKASKPEKSGKVSTKASVRPERSDDELHAARLLKMAKVVSQSPHVEPMDHLVAAYAKATFHPKALGKVNEAEAIDERHQTQAYKHTYKDRSVRNDGPRDNTDPNNIKDQHRGLVTMNVAKDGPFPIKTAKGNYKDDSSRQRANKPGGYIDKQFPNEAAEAIVNKFLEDTTTGDIGSIALGFAPTGEMDPHEGRPGPGKKKKKKVSQFAELADMVSKYRYRKLTQKVAAAMPT